MASPDKPVSLRPEKFDISAFLLTRFEQIEGSTYGVFEGILPDGKKEPLGFTIELPWLNNHPLTSCIPVGVYPIKKHYSGTLGWCIAVNDVPGRSLIRVHVANTIDDLTGCIGPGLRRGRLDGKPAVLYSHVALQRILGRFSGVGTLTIEGNP